MLILAVYFCKIQFYSDLGQTNPNYLGKASDSCYSVLSTLGL